MENRPLTGLTILDLSQQVAGPFATRMLAGYGADVIKIERPGTGDPARTAGPFPDDIPDPERSARFLLLNTGKQSLSLNLKSRTGRDLFLDLAASADVVVENFRPGTLDALGIGWSTLHARNPALALISITNYGQTGPYRDYAGTNLTLFAAGGQMSVTGDADREPLVNGGTQALFQAGLHGFSATLAAVFGARAHGRGAHVDISIQEVQAASLEGGGPNANVYGLDATRTGNLAHALWGLYPCADGYVACCSMERQVPNLLRMIGREDLLDSPFRNARWRTENADEVIALLIGFFVERTQAELRELGMRFGVPIGMTPTVEDLLGWPPLHAKGFWREVTHPAAGTLTYPGPPFTIDGSGFELTPAPLLGEHTELILRDRLGLDAAEIAALRDRGIV